MGSHFAIRVVRKNPAVLSLAVQITVFFAPCIVGKFRAESISDFVRKVVVKDGFAVVPPPMQ